MRKMIARAALVFLFIVAAGSFLIACASVKIFSPKEVVLFEGESIHMGAVLVPFGEEDDIQYYTSAPEVATVSSGGIINAVSRGEALITATIKNALTQTVVKVLTPAQSIEVSQKAQLVPLGKSAEIREVATTPSGSVATVEWKAENEDIAKVENNKIEGLAIGVTRILGEYTWQESTQEVSYPVFVLQSDVVEAIPQTDFDLDFAHMTVWRADYYILHANTANPQGLTEFLEEGGGVSSIDKKTWYLSGIEFGFVYDFLEEGEVNIHIHKKYPVDTAIDVEYYIFEDVQNFFAQNQEGTYRVVGASKKTAELLLLDFFDIYVRQGGGAAFVLPAPNPKDTQYIYNVQQRGVDWSIVIKLEELDGITFVDMILTRIEAPAS